MIRLNVANSHFSDQVNESDFKIRSPKSGPSQARLQDSAKLIETAGSRTTKRHVVTGGIDASSIRLMSKQLHLQNNPFRHQHQQEQNQEMVLVRSLTWQANRQPRTQHQSHRGAQCQVRGQEQERGFARRSFDLRLEKRNGRPGKSVVRGTIRKTRDTSRKKKETLRERKSSKRHSKMRNLIFKFLH